jgi:predicted GH43/DUF377 family glycosyl hydrolase
MPKIGLIPRCPAKWAEVSKNKWIKNSKPVITPGPSGSFDERVVASPYVLEEPVGFYSLYYMAQNREGTKWGIGLATSQDLVNWEKYEGSPVLAEEMVGWGRKIDGPFINKLDDLYYLFYETAASPHWFHRLQSLIYAWGLRVIFNKKLLNKLLNKYLLSQVSIGAIHAHQRQIGFATSSDGRLWKDYSLNPVFRKNKKDRWDSAGVFGPKVYKIDGQYWMYYSGSCGSYVNSGLAFSSDLRNWQRYKKNPILRTGSKGEWDELCVVFTSIIQLNDVYLAFYEGEDAKNIYRIGLAYSSNLKEWKKFDGNPVIDIGKSGSFDDKVVNAPHVVVYKEKLYLLYSVFNQEYKGSIGLAILDLKQ